MSVDSGAWLKAGMSMINKRFIMSNDEFAAALCRRNTFECSVVPRSYRCFQVALVMFEAHLATERMENVRRGVAHEI